MGLPSELKEKIAWLFLLLPGFLSFTIIDVIAGLDELSDFQIVVYSFALTLVNIAISILFYIGLEYLAAYRCLNDETKLAARSQHWINWISTGGFFITLFFVSIVVGLFGGNAIESDLFYKSAKKFTLFGLIERDSAKQPLDLVLYRNARGLLPKGELTDGRIYPKDRQKEEQWLRIRVKGGKQFDGYPRHYDLRIKPSQIYLSPACEVDTTSDPKMRPIKGAGVIIYERSIEQVYLFDKQSLCRRYWLEKPNKRKENSEFTRLIPLGGS